MRPQSLSRVFAPLVLIGLTAAGCNASASQDDDQILHKVSYSFPIPGEGVYDDIETVDQEDLDPNQFLHIAADKKLTFRGKSYEDMAAALVAARATNLPKVELSIAAAAKFGDVVTALAGAKTEDLVILGNEAHKKFGKRRREELIAGPDLTFRGSTVGYQSRVVVSYAAKEDACLASLAELEVNSDELFDQSFMILDGWVMDAGGVESIIDEINAGADIVARIQATADTPWRCVAGAMYNVQIAGMPDASLEVVKPHSDPKS